MKRFIPLSFAFLLLLSSILRAAAVPETSTLFAPDKDQMLMCIDPMEGGSQITTAGWHLLERGIEVADPAIGTKVGRQALRFFGEVEATDGKGDFTITEPGFSKDIHALGLWVYIPEQGQGVRVSELGFQIHDAEGESLKWGIESFASGWQWIEASTLEGAFTQSYPQKDKNAKVDLPLKSIHVYWFGKGKGETSIVVDGLTALTKKNSGEGLAIKLFQEENLKAGQKAAGSLVITNGGNREISYSAVVTVARDSHNDASPIPHPVMGSNHAPEAKSWTMYNGERSAENTLVDQLTYTVFNSPYDKDGNHQAVQIIEMNQPRTLTHMTWHSGDANWIGAATVESSIDGKTFTPVPGLESVNMTKKWGWNSFPLQENLQAQFLRFTYTLGPKNTFLRLPAEIALYDGVADETLALPPAGEEIGTVEIKGSIKPGSYTISPFELAQELSYGAYRVEVAFTYNQRTELTRSHIFIGPSPFKSAGKDSAFGLNASRLDLIEENATLGIGWARFENFKWPMTSPAPHQYDFSGNVKPWVVPFDEIIRKNRDMGIHVLPMMFLAPEWSIGNIPQGYKGSKLALPPEDLSLYGEFAFQSVARYGSTQVSADKLLTPDKQTGLGLMDTFELGNEPNLNPFRGKEYPSWGAWAGTMKQFWDMFKYGVKGVRDADPQALVCSPGWAGMTVDSLDQIRTYTYEDGSSPLDLVDILSVHFYSGRTAPELATGDANASVEGAILFEEHLTRLAEWRDLYKPGAPIWMTETGYDTGGPIGTNETIQAARLPRVVMLCLAGGIDKVFVYRESGSTPTQHAAAGMLRNDFSRRPVYYTYATLIRQLDGKKFVEDLSVSHDSTRILRWAGGGEEVLSVWSVPGATAFEYELGPVEVTDSFGATTQLQSTKGLQLSEYPLYLKNVKSLEPLASQKKQQQQRLAERRATVQKMAAREFKLINFGTSEMPISLWLGKMRQYQNLTSKDIYTREKGMGFTGEGATGDTVSNWKKEQTEKQQVHIRKGESLKIDLAPGTWRYTLMATPWRDTEDFKVFDGNTALDDLIVRKDSEITTGEITLSQGSLRLESTYQAKLFWMNLEKIN